MTTRRRKKRPTVEFETYVILVSIESPMPLMALDSIRGLTDRIYAWLKDSRPTKTFGHNLVLSVSAEPVCKVRLRVRNADIFVWEDSPGEGASTYPVQTFLSVLGGEHVGEVLGEIAKLNLELVGKNFDSKKYSTLTLLRQALGGDIHALCQNTPSLFLPF